MTQCTAATKKGTQCTKNAVVNNLCRVHQKQQERKNEPKQSCVTITFGDVAENHVGMQKIGEMIDEGLTVAEMKELQIKLMNMGMGCFYLDLSDKKLCLVPDDVELEEAGILVIENFAQFNPDEMLEEQMALDWDTKAFMKGRVVNKHARYNLCYSDEPQEPNYEEGKGRVVSYDEVPLLKACRDKITELFGSKCKDLKAEGNLYYDISKCGIGWHGDAERRIVIAVRLGVSIPLSYQWYRKSSPIGRRMDITLEHGNMYIMSEKATGCDWKKRNKATLRHAAGCDKYIK